MGYDFPNLGKDQEAIPTLTNPKLNGTIVINGVTVTATPAELNLVAGIISGGYTLLKYVELEIVCANGIAQTGAVATIPKGAVIMDVMTWCTQAFNGGTTKTFEVGIAANTDKYIDPVDCPVTLDGVMDIFIGTNQDQKTAEPLGADMPVTYKYTNSAGATTGKMKVRIAYF